MSAKRDLISIEDFSKEEIEEIFSIADEMDEIIKNKGRSDLCYGKIMATLFFEPSTRTRFSFETAMQRLGGGIISAPDMSVTSTKKGETLPDTIKTVSQYADIIVIRHPRDGAAKVAADCAEIPVINAGDGKHEHPTQTLLDLYTLKKERGSIKGLTVALCGDLKYARSIHSLAYGLARLGADIVCIPAKGHQIPYYVSQKLARKHGTKLRRTFASDFKLLEGRIDAIYMTPSREFSEQLDLPIASADDSSLTQYISEYFTRKMTELVHGFDAFYITRIQRERLVKSDKQIKPKEDYPIVDDAFLKDKKFENTLIMHPLPRVDELSPKIDGDSRAIYFKQARYGVPVRMALLTYLLGLRKAPKPQGTSGQKIPSRKMLSSREVGYISCNNANCILNDENEFLTPEFKYPHREKNKGFHALIYSCAYCDTEIHARYVGNFGNKKYTKVHPSFEKKISDWRNRDHLVVFVSEGEAENAGFNPYRAGKGRLVLNERQIQAGIVAIAYQIEHTEDLRDVVFIGIEKKGTAIAERLRLLVKARKNMQMPVAKLDVYSYRDDRSFIDEHQETKIPFSVDNKIVVLVDDLIATGRTARAALDAMIDQRIGRPRGVKLFVIIDVANAREFPIHPNSSIKKIQLGKNQIVKLGLKEMDGADEVRILSTRGTS